MTLPETKCRAVVLEGDLEAYHGPVIEYEDIDQGGQQQKQQLPVPESFSKPRADTVLCCLHSSAPRKCFISASGVIIQYVKFACK